MGTKNNPGKYDCHSRAEPDEPMFVLLGRDAHAAFLVRAWVMMKLTAGESMEDEKLQEAMACAQSMEDWAKKLGKDVVLAEQHGVAFAANLMEERNQ